MAVGLAAWYGKAAGVRIVEPSSGKRQRGEILSILAKLPDNDAATAEQVLADIGRLVHADTTAIVFTPRPGAAPGTMMRRADAPMLEIVASSPQADLWFRFPASIHFTACAPIGSKPAVVMRLPPKRGGKGPASPDGGRNGDPHEPGRVRAMAQATP